MSTNRIGFNLSALFLFWQTSESINKTNFCFKYYLNIKETKKAR